MHSCCIVVPIYRVPLADDEFSSMLNICDCLGSWNIVIIKPESLQIDSLIEGIRRHRLNSSLALSHSSFPDAFFESIHGYNSLMLSLDFYSRFGCWDYILIAQLDCWIFCDNLCDWLMLNYSYIGAPWLALEGLPWGMRIARESVGNGGLSLRRVQDFKYVLSSWRFRNWPVLGISELLDEHHPFQPLLNGALFPGIQKTFNRLLIILARLMSWKNSLHYYSQSGINEDVILSILCPKVFARISVACPSLAARFSLDANSPFFYYKYLSSGLPFGCHGWTKESYSFLRKLILRTMSI